MGDVFEKEIAFLAKVFDNEKQDWKHEMAKKTATFKEFSRTEQDQHKLHFKIISLFTGGTIKDDDGEDKKTQKVDGDELYDLTVKCIKKLLVVNEAFTATDKEEFLNDSGAISSFGFWLLKEKTLPFFAELNRT